MIVKQDEAFSLQQNYIWELFYKILFINKQFKY